MPSRPLQTKPTVICTRSHSSPGHPVVDPTIQKPDSTRRYVLLALLSLGSLSAMSTLLLSTPAKNTRNSATKFAATTQPLNELCNNMDSEMRKCFVGPMAVRDFLEKFLPVELPPARRDQLPEFGVMAGLRLESQMYNTFVRSSLATIPILISERFAYRSRLRIRSVTGPEHSTHPKIPPARRIQNTNRTSLSTTRTQATPRTV